MGIKKSILVVLIFVVVIASAALFLKSVPAPPARLPNPNGYDDIMKVVQLARVPTSPLETFAESDRRKILLANEPALKLVHEALQKECAISDAHALAATNSAHSDNLLAMKTLAQAFVMRGGAASAEHRNRDAAIDYLDALRLGAKGLQGGVMFDRMIAEACEKIGAQALKKQLPELSAAECREVLKALEEIEQQREPFETTLANEREYIAQNFTLSQRFAGLLMFKSQKQVVEKFRAKTEAVILFERQLQLDLAARAFDLEKGKRPTSARELVPIYLKMIPQDPTTKTNLSL